MAGKYTIPNTYIYDVCTYVSNIKLKLYILQIFPIKNSAANTNEHVESIFYLLLSIFFPVIPNNIVKYIVYSNMFNFNILASNIFL